MARQKLTDRPVVMRTFFIYTDQDEELASLASALGKNVSKTDLVREAIDHLIKQYTAQEKRVVNE